MIINQFENQSINTRHISDQYVVRVIILPRVYCISRYFYRQFVKAHDFTSAPRGMHIYFSLYYRLDGVLKFLLGHPKVT